MLQRAQLRDLLVFISILRETRRRNIELTLLSCYPFLPGSDFIFYYSLQDEETHDFVHVFKLVDLGAIKLLKNWNAEIKKMWNAYKTVTVSVLTALAQLSVCMWRDYLW